MLIVYKSLKLRKNPDTFRDFSFPWQSIYIFQIHHVDSSHVSKLLFKSFVPFRSARQRWHRVYLMLKKHSERMQKCVTIWLLVHLSTGYMGHWDPSECYWYWTLTGNTWAGPHRTEVNTLRGVLHLQTLELVTNQRKLLAASKCSSSW